MGKEVVENYCCDCKKETNHYVEYSYEVRPYDEEYPEETNFMTEFSIVKCMGCSHISFRKAFHDFNKSFYDDLGELEWSITYETYPKVTDYKLEIHYLPPLIKNIYKQSCTAMGNNLPTLAGAGFRATLEAICNDQGIKGKDLLQKIDGMEIKKIISTNQANMLHSVRFLGNDAVHEIANPSERQLSIIQEIIIILLKSLYITEKHSSRLIDTIIKSYPEFEELLLEKIEDNTFSEKVSLQNILGKDYRVMKGNYEKFEQELRKNIGQGKFINLKFSHKKDDVYFYEVKA